MVVAVGKVEEGTGIQEAARLYNVPIETLWRQVAGVVTLDCKPGSTHVFDIGS